MYKGYVYKITFPNGKIYIGIDFGRSSEIMANYYCSYFGSFSEEDVRKDFNEEELICFIIKKEILQKISEKDVKTLKQKLAMLEGEYIREFNSNKSEIGYNKTHKRINTNKEK